MNINKVVASVEKLHGDSRAQRRTYESYTAWLLRQRLNALGRTVLKEENTDERA